MRKNKMMRLASGLLVAVLLTTSMISGTFAKYVAQMSATDDARVAKFSVTALGKEVTDTQAATIDVFDASKVYEADANGDQEVDDAEIKNDATKAIIAPGSWGKFTFNMLNESEVTVKYTISYADSNEAGVPLEWSLDGQDWEDDITALNVAGNDAVVLDYDGARDNAKTSDAVTIYWRWAFEGTDVKAGATQSDPSDTALGTATTLAEPTVKITVDFEQVN